MPTSTTPKPPGRAGGKKTEGSGRTRAREVAKRHQPVNLDGQGAGRWLCCCGAPGSNGRGHTLPDFDTHIFTNFDAHIFTDAGGQWAGSLAAAEARVACSAVPVAAAVRPAGKGHTLTGVDAHIFTNFDAHILTNHLHRWGGCGRCRCCMCCARCWQWRCGAAVGRTCGTRNRRGTGSC